MSEKKHQKAEDFQQLVEAIRAAEGEADRVKTDYDAKISQLMKKGREKSVELREFYEKRAADAKSKILSSERKKTETLVEQIVGEAKQQASSLRAKLLNKKQVEDIFENFTASL